MNSVNKTLYIPLYGKAYVSRKGILLHDPRAEEIWAAEGFRLKGKSRSKWLAYYMGMRSAVFDRWLKAKMAQDPGAVILHIGCGMDSRAERVGTSEHVWYDIDFPEVIAERRRYYPVSETYRMLAADVRTGDWLAEIPGESAIVVMEGVSMYLRPEELRGLLANIRCRFSNVRLLMDCYTELAARASRYKNPINDVGVTEVYGLDDPKALDDGGLRFVTEMDMTPQDMVNQLDGMEKKLFKTLYAGGIARRMYRLYEYGSETLG